MKIGVIGLGFAGLRTMQLLEADGHDVTGFEARDRIGGRCHTVREGEVIFEAGGEWIDADHHRVLDLLRHNGREPLSSDSSPRRLIFGGRESNWDELWGDPEIRADVERFESRVESEVGLVTEPDSTLQAFIDESVTTEAGRWYLTAMYRSDEGEDLDRIGRNGWFRAYENYRDREGGELSAFRFPRGASDLLDRMAAEIRGQLHLNCPVTKIVEAENGVWVETATGRHGFDRVVMTVPGAAFGEMRLPAALAESDIAKIPLARAIKITFLFGRGWWREEGWDGSLMYDGPLQQFWDGGLGSGPVLQAYVTGGEAQHWVTRPDAAMAATEELFRVFPQAQAWHLETRVNDWVGDPWARGAFGYFPPGFKIPSLEPVGRIHLAGEATAKWNGFIEGALESAERVAGEIESEENSQPGRLRIA